MLMDSQSIEAALSLGWSDARNPLLTALLLPVLGLAVQVVVQIIVLRLQRGRGFLRSLAAGFVAGGLLTLVAYPLAARHWCSMTYGEPALASLLLEWLLLVAPAYAGLGYGYANFANLGNSSIRIRMYEELRRFPSGCLLSDLRREFDETSILRLRLQRMEESGDLVNAGGVWKCARRRFIVIGAVIFFAKRLILGRSSEFDEAFRP